MDFYNLVSNVGLAAEEVAVSRAVLNQAVQFFESTKKEEIDLIPYYADTIRRLLNATDSLLFQLCDTLQNCHDRALKQYREDIQNGKTYIHTRCYNPNSPSYPNYGGRGNKNV